MKTLGRCPLTGRRAKQVSSSDTRSLITFSTTRSGLNDGQPNSRADVALNGRIFVECAWGEAVAERQSRTHCSQSVWHEESAAVILLTWWVAMREGTV